MLTLDLLPGAALGPFALGVAVGEALAVAAELSEGSEAARVEVKISEEPEQDIVLNFPEHGFHLRFVAQSQALRLIEVYDPTRLSCRYNGAAVGGAAPVTLQRVSALFGPTYPGEVCHTSARALFALHYPGLLFLFPGVSPTQATCAARVVLCAPAVAGAHARLEAVLAAAPPGALPPGASDAPAIVAAMGFGLRLAGGGVLPFGASPQDLIAELGPPSASLVKRTDAMLIHAAPGQLPVSGEYFLTWFARGLDVLVDGETHRAKKFVLHTNPPCHPDFGSYAKASFALETPRGALLSADAPWEEVQAALGPNERPAVNTGLGGGHPFGLSTFVFAYNGAVLEVMRNGRLASVTLFQPRRAAAAGSRGA